MFNSHLLIARVTNQPPANDSSSKEDLVAHVNNLLAEVQ